MKKPCNNCPFRPRTFTPLVADDVATMLDEVIGRESFFMYCHKDHLYQSVECRGSALFRQGSQGGEVFRSERALARAHARTRRKVVLHWNRDDEDPA